MANKSPDRGRESNPFECLALADYPILVENGTQYAVCPVCNLRIYSLRNMDAHIKRHFESHTCEVCSKTFRSKRDLQSHGEVHSGVDVVCPECGVSFRSKALYRSHRWRKHRNPNGGTAKKVKCPMCSKSMRLDSVDRHLVNQHHVTDKRVRSDLLEQLKEHTSRNTNSGT